MLFPVLVLTGCLFIIDVNQPGSGVVDEPFTVTVEMEVHEFCDEGTCFPLFGIAIPPDWVIESCSYTGDISGTCEEDTLLGLSINFGPTDPDNVWVLYVGEDQHYFEEDRTTVTWVVRPMSAGEHILDYAAGGYGSDSGGISNHMISESDASLNHPITIEQDGLPVPPPAPIPVPGLGIVGILVLVLSMLLMLRFSGRIVRRNR